MGWSVRTWEVHKGISYEIRKSSHVEGVEEIRPEDISLMLRCIASYSTDIWNTGFDESTYYVTNDIFIYLDLDGGCITIEPLNAASKFDQVDPEVFRNVIQNTIEYVRLSIRGGS